jgi:hypothetical protein
MSTNHSTGSPQSDQSEFERRWLPTRKGIPIQIWRPVKTTPGEGEPSLIAPPPTQASLDTTRLIEKTRYEQAVGSKVTMTVKDVTSFLLAVEETPTLMIALAITAHPTDAFSSLVTVRLGVSLTAHLGGMGLPMDLVGLMVTEVHGKGLTSSNIKPKILSTLKAVR